jgi:hypothetical protein
MTTPSSSATLFTARRLSCLSLNSLKRRSTMLSQDAPVGMKCRCHRALKVYQERRP